MKINKIFIFSLLLITIMSMAVVSATEDNSTISDNQTLQSIENEAISIDSDNEILTDEDNGTYLDPTEAYECLNEFRTSKGAWYWDRDDENIVYFNTNEDNQLKPLVIDKRLEEVAKIRAKEIAILFDHVRPDGSSFATLFPELDGNGYMSENIAFSYMTGKTVTEAWKESFLGFAGQGHRQGMLSPYCNCVGIAGYLTSDGVPYWVQSFGNIYIPTNQSDKNETPRNESKGTFSDLNALIAVGNSIQLDKDYEFYNESSLSSGIIIDKPVTIDGCGHSIDAGGKSRIFNITSQGVILKNIKFLNAYLDYIDGGAIHSTESLTLINCSFMNNFAYAGSCVYSAKGKLSLIDCSFKDNYGVKGSVYAEGTVSVVNCDFENNSAILYGAGLCLKDAEADISGSVFTNNSAYNGGSVYLTHSNASYTNCNFTQNTLDSDGYANGGAVYAGESSSSFKECNFLENDIMGMFRQANGGALFLTGGDALIFDCNFANNIAKYYGGAMCLVNINATLERCRFDSNGLSKFYDEVYGVLYSISYGGALFGESSNITINDSIFLNHSANNGGAIAMNAFDLSIEDCDFSNNTADNNGGSLFLNNADVTVCDSRFSNNTCGFSGGAIYLDNGNISFTGNIVKNNTANYGGGLRINNAQISISNNNFTDNSVTKEFGASGGALFLNNCEGSVELSNFENNSVYTDEYSSNGGAITFDGGNFSLNGCNFTKSSVSGGAVYSNRANVSVSECSFTDLDLEFSNILYCTDAHTLLSDCIFDNINIAYGSALSLSGGDMQISNSHFSDIFTNYDGGSLLSWGCDVSILDCDFTNNLASAGYSKNGGTLCLNNGYVFITNSNFTNSFATSYGGAVYLNNCHGSIEKSSFENSTINSTYYDVSGCALYSIGGDIVIADCTFANNKANTTNFVYGGAAYLREGNYSVINCIFINNSVSSSYASGGALYSKDSNVSISNAIFIENTAPRGGALYAENGNINIDNSKFENNSASYEGGALALNAFNTFVESTIFTDNHAEYGGVILVYEGNLSVSDSSFTNNSAISGGAIYVYLGNATVISSNFTNNSAKWYGGALYNCNAIDSIFTNNIAETAGAMYGCGNNATRCIFIRNVAYHDSPIHEVNANDCTLTDNRLITRVIIDVSYVQQEYYQTDMMYVQVCLSDNPYQLITNATVTIRLYKDDAFVNEFNFSSGDDGWIVNVSEGEYFAELRIVGDNFEANQVNITFNVLKKEIATADITFGNYTFSNPVVIGIKSNVDAYAQIYIDDVYIDYLEVSGNENMNLTYDYLQAGLHRFKVILAPKNSKIDQITVTKEFEVFKKETSILLTVDDATIIDDVIAYVLSSETAEISINVVNLTQTVFVYANESTQVYIGPLTAGEYVVEATLDAGENYLVSSDSKNITIKNIIAGVNVTVGEDTFPNPVIMDVESNVDATVEIYIDDNYIDWFNVIGNENGQHVYYDIQAGSHALRVVLTPSNSRISPVTENKNFTVSKKETSIKLDVTNVTDKENVIVSIQASEDGDVSVKIGDLIKSIHVNANQDSQIDFGLISSGEYVVEATFDAGDNYFPSSDSKALNVLKKITQEDIKISESDSKNIVINLPDDATGTVTLTIAGQNYDVEIINGTAEVTLPDLGSGEYPYTITYSGDDKYSSFSIDGNMNQSSSEESPKIKPDITIPEFKDDGKVELPADATGTVTLTVNGNDYVFDVVNGIVDVELPELADGDYDYTITYSGDDKYSSYVANGTLKLNGSQGVVKANPELNIGVLDVAFGEVVVVNVSINENATGSVIVSLNGSESVVSISNGKCSLSISDLAVGSYAVLAKYVGDDCFNSSEVSASFNVIESGGNGTGAIVPEIVIPPLDEPSNDGSVTVTLQGDATGTVTLTVNGKDYVFEVKDGSANVVIPDLENGNYSYTVSYSGDGKYSSFTSVGVLNVNNTLPKPLLIPDVSIPSLNDGLDVGYVIVSVPADVEAKVELSISGNTYVFDVVNGKANVTLPDLADGDYDYSIKYCPQDKYANYTDVGVLTVNRSSDEKPVPEIVIPPLDEPSNDGSVTVTLPGDATGTVTLTVNGKDYTYPVENGMAKVIIPDLDGGNYPYIIAYSGDGKYSSFTNNGTFNKQSPMVDPVITASNAKVTYSAGSYYTIKVNGTDGKPASGVKIVITVKGKTFKTLTVTNGVAKFKITSIPGTYKMNITALGKSITKTLTVKHLLTLKLVTVKKSAKKLVLTATLGKINKKYLKNKKITFKFNGKKYTAKTDKKGVAKVTIKSNVLKKLKVGKKVTYQATYSKDTVKKNVKIKK